MNDLDTKETSGLSPVRGKFTNNSGEEVNIEPKTKRNAGHPASKMGLLKNNIGNCVWSHIMI